jgi:hypothetical protein
VAELEALDDWEGYDRRRVVTASVAQSELSS